MSEPVLPPDSVHVQTVADALRALSDGAERYLAHLRSYLGMSRSDLYALRFVAAHCENGAPLSPSQLAKLLGLSNAATTALLDRLEDAGHIERELVEGDRRRRRIIINEQSAALAVDMFAPLDHRVAATLNEFEGHELVLIAKSMDRLAQAVADACAEVCEPDFVLPVEETFPY